MKPKILLVLSFALLFVLSGCFGGSTVSQLDKPVSEETWYIGCWHDDDGYILYIPNPTGSLKSTVPVFHLTYDDYHDGGPIEYSGYFMNCIIVPFDNNEINLLEVDDEGYVLETYIAIKDELRMFRDGYDYDYRKDDTVDRMVLRQMNKVLRQQQKEERIVQNKNEEARRHMQNLSDKYQWIYGEWDSDGYRMNLSQPNTIKMWFDSDKEFKFNIIDDEIQVIRGVEEDDDYYLKLDVPNQVITKTIARVPHTFAKKGTKESDSSKTEIDRKKVLGVWKHFIKQSGNVSTGNFGTIVLRETLVLQANGSGRLEERVNEYVGTSLISTRAGDSFSFSWELMGNGIYIDGDRNPDFVYIDGKLIDSGRNEFTK